MRHFDLSQWADFARGVASDTARAAMESHVLSGCHRCDTTLALMRRIVATVRAASEDTVPENVVRCARAISALQRPQKVSKTRLLARLVFDSLQDPVPAGIRADDRASHHALYEAGDYCVDVRVEQEKGEPVVSLVGQITNRQDPNSDFVAAPVLLVSRKAIIGHALYNRFGEFRLEAPVASGLRLRVSIDESGASLEVPLSRLGTSEPTKPKRAVLKRLEGERNRKRRS